MIKYLTLFFTPLLSIAQLTENNVTFGFEGYNRGANVAVGGSLSVDYLPKIIHDDGVNKLRIGGYVNLTKRQSQYKPDGRRFDMSQKGSGGVSWAYHNDDFYVLWGAGIAITDFVPKSNADLIYRDKYRYMYELKSCVRYTVDKPFIVSACLNHNSLGNSNDGIGFILPDLAHPNVPNINANSLSLGVTVGF